MQTQPQPAFSEAFGQPGRASEVPVVPPLLRRLVTSGVFPILIAVLGLIHKLNKHQRLLWGSLAAVCAAAWIAGSCHWSLATTLSQEAIGCLKWTTTLLLAAFTAFDCFIQQVRRDPKSPVRTLNDCLDLPAPPSRSSNGRQEGFRFRCVSSSQDIPAIAQLCSKEPVFAAANPSLPADRREQIYKEWFELSPNSFYVLEHHSTQGIKVAAVSIILPLTACGATRLWTGEAGVTELSGGDIACDSRQTTRILLDTLFVTKEFRGIAKHKKYPWALVLKHLSEYIHPQSRHIQAFVLPDVPSTRRVLRQVGFEGPHSTQKERGLYRIQVAKRLTFVPEAAVEALAFMPAKPMTRLLALLLEAEVVSRILENIDICRRWECADA